MQYVMKSDYSCTMETEECFLEADLKIAVNTTCV